VLAYVTIEFSPEVVLGFYGSVVSSRGVKNLSWHLSHIARVGVLLECLRITKRRSAIASSRVPHTVPESEVLGFGRFPSVLQPHLAHIAFLMNRFPILISHGDLEIQGFIADVAE
jgi:hypothetical protein